MYALITYTNVEVKQTDDLFEATTYVYGNTTITNYIVK